MYMHTTMANVIKYYLARSSPKRESNSTLSRITKSFQMKLHERQPMKYKQIYI